MKHRIDKLRQEMKKEGLDGFIVQSDENRFYLTGFTGTAGLVLFTTNNNYFITDFRYIEQARQQVKDYQILEITEKQLENVAELLQENQVKKLGFESGRLTFQQYSKFKELFTGVELTASQNLVEKIRIVKEDSEIDRIRKAVEITDQAFNHILDYIKPGVSERDVALELEYFMKKQGAEKNSFDFIVASGKRSSMPHGVATSKKIEKGDFVTMDFGTVYQGYCSDMTRTVVIGKPDQQQKEIYQLVLQAQLAVIDRVKAGMTGKQVDAIARDIIYQAGYTENFGHGLGHGLGIEIHEAPRASLSSDDIMKPGMVITDEPGIYLPDWGGVRIEDDLVITEEGCIVLNSSPKELISL